MTGFLVLDGLTRTFAGGGGVRDLSLSIGRGELVAILGPSGSGKTTTLRLLAGFETPDRGRIVVDGEDVSALPAAARRFGMVFQHYALFPHLTVGRNVSFGLEGRGIGSREVIARVASALAAVDLAGFEPRSIGSLSGGQQQRVALARALAPEPRVLLLDEPLSNLDPTLRERTRRELRDLVARIGITTILVTHEQEEAFDLADRIAVLAAGAFEQVDTPIALYRTPATRFVAGFIGRATMLAGTAARTPSGLAVTVAEGLPPFLVNAPGPEGPVTLACRPEAFRLVAPAEGRWVGRVADRRFQGHTALYRVALEGGGPELEALGPADAVELGGTVGLAQTGQGAHLFAGAAG